MVVLHGADMRAMASSSSPLGNPGSCSSGCLTKMLLWEGNEFQLTTRFLGSGSMSYFPQAMFGLH
jgi:hypothetical protein